jgi:hypothetical protein
MSARSLISAAIDLSPPFAVAIVMSRPTSSKKPFTIATYAGA